jgi:hypothetical protein
VDQQVPEQELAEVDQQVPEQELAEVDQQVPEQELAGTTTLTTFRSCQEGNQQRDSMGNHTH